MHTHTSNIQTAKDVFNLFENPGLSHPMLNFVTICPAGTEVWPKICFTGF